MIHVRMPHSKGDAMQAARYLLSEKDHAGKPRRVAPEILEGDPLMVASIANQTHRAHKYACGCLSFRDNEQPMPAQQKEIMRDFERTFLPGLQKGQHYAIAWVAHEDKDSRAHLAHERYSLNRSCSRSDSWSRRLMHLPVVA
ncbi:hypothetical protein [Burkholderia pseudomallei]|uniref:hypothetical protein n=1 Tax=Burkholderia pseudomallei TaxID=28450 RepID=UPI00016ABC58|nr:hypothetical protein [Burkholderia pseudomallei]MBF3450748.1 hypothetical protein [Burkholderia pseudomallei]MBF3813498.1 hypothetical protein [Burkholderia pseudomallei]MBF3843622.1 hypothetical protein [Burkholderia pseudomallei]MPT67431.1 hypothetical protein [Burkholderia pseudomallei]MPT74315.1 hypothetical protein [Burkholderia pseudomallei]